MYTKGEYDADLRAWQKEVGNLTNDFEAVCRQLKYKNLIDTCKELRTLAEEGLVDYSKEEYATDIVSLLNQFYKLDMTDRLNIKKEGTES